MSKEKFETVDQYIKSFPPATQKILRLVQKTIQKAVPEAEETISYQMPAFKNERWIFYYSAYPNHYSLSCPPPFTVFDEFKTELANYEVSKTAIKFPLDKPVPEELIGKMAAFRAEQNKRIQKKKVVKTPAKKGKAK